MLITFHIPHLNFANGKEKYFLSHHIFLILINLGEIVDGIVGVISLGFLQSSFSIMALSKSIHHSLNSNRDENVEG